MPPAPHVAAAIAASGPRQPAQPSRPPRPPRLSAHVQEAIAAGRGGAPPVQARFPAAPFPRPVEVARGFSRPSSVVQAMEVDQKEDLWELPGFLFNQHGGFYVGQAPKSEIEKVGGEKPKKTYLYLGAGDLLAPARKVQNPRESDHRFHANLITASTRI